MTQQPTRILRIGNKPETIYLSSATTILESKGELIICGLGPAIVPTCKLSLMLEGFGYKRRSMELTTQVIEGRSLDPKEEPVKALKDKKFVSTGVMIKVPKLTITLCDKL